LNTSAIALLSLILFCLFFYNPFNFFQTKEAPTVAGAWPVLGHLPLLSGSKRPHRTLGALADKYGPIFTIQLGSKKALVINNWEMAKECFTTNDMAVSSRPKLIAIELMGYNAMFGFVPYGPYWRELRKIVTLEILTTRRVEQLQHVRVSELQNSIKELHDVWCSQKSESGYALVELKQWFSHLAFNMVLRMVVGKRYFGGENLDNEKAQRCVKAVEEFMRLLGVFAVGDAVPWLRWFHFGGHEKAMKETAKELDSIIGEELEEHRKRKGLGEKDDEAQDFMEVMISLLDGRTIDGIDADTMIKSTVLVRMFNKNVLLTLTNIDLTPLALMQNANAKLVPPHILTNAKLLTRVSVSDYLCDVYDHQLFMKKKIIFFNKNHILITSVRWLNRCKNHILHRLDDLTDVGFSTYTSTHKTGYPCVCKWLPM